MSFVPNPSCLEYRKLPCTYSREDERTTDIISTTTHNIDHDYNLTLFGVNIPILKTKRTFQLYSNHYVSRLYPASGWGVNINVGFLGGILACTEKEEDVFTASILEDCVIEKSTLAYIDNRRSVILYRYDKQWVKFYKRTTDTCEWRELLGTTITNKLVLKRNDINSGRTVEWRLIVGGHETILYSNTDTKWHPFGESVSVLKEDGTYTDPDIVQIISHGQPASQALPYDLDIKALGFYDYGNLPGEESLLNKLDGGNKDYFYPEWCRNLHNDPIWREIADNRYMISWFHAEAVQNKNWYPPEINTDPIPHGNHIYHPAFGDLWQWLLPEKDNSIFVASNIEFINNLLDKALAENGITATGTKLYYPIGVL